MASNVLEFCLERFCKILFCPSNQVNLYCRNVIFNTSACIYYLLLTISISVNLLDGNLRFKQLDIQTAAQLTNTSIVTINGIVDARSRLRTVSSIQVAIRVESGGVLHVKESGMVILDRE